MPKINLSRHKQIANSMFIVIIISPIFISIDYSLEEQIKIFDSDPPRITPLFAIKSDESVDADSNVDASANIGDDAATSYVDSQTLNAVDQIITEGQGAGYVAPTDTEDYHDAITDSQTPADVGTYSNGGLDMDSAPDSTMETLTEANAGGGGGITVEGTYTGNCRKTNTCTISSVVVPSASDLAIYVFVSAYTKSTAGCAGNQEESTVIFDVGGVDESFTNVGCANPNKDRTSIWRYLSPTVQTADITLDNSGSNNWNWDGSTFAAIVMSGVHQTTSDDGFNSNSGNSGASQVTVSSATNDLVLDVVATRSTATVDGSQTELWNVASSSNNEGGGSSEAGAASVSMDWTFSSNTWGAAGVSINPAGSGTNYRFDREFAFTSLDFNDAGGEELAIKTGVIGAESLQVYVWDSSAWTLLTTIVDANDNTWINVSIASYLDTSAEYFSFRDATITSDATQNTWEIDAVLIHSWNNAVNDYELDWEHQASSLPAYSTDNTYELTIFGSYTTGGSETLTLEIWNSSSSSWDGTAVTLTIAVTEQWYNATINCGSVGICGTTMTWRYNDGTTSSDSTQDTLSIDYSGIYIYSLDVILVSGTGSVSVTPDGADYPILDSLSQADWDLTIDAGVNFDLEIKGIDTTGTPVASNYIYFDTDSNPAGYIQLTSSYQTLYSNQDSSTTTLQFWSWSTIPPPLLVQTLNFDFDIRIIIYVP